MRIEYTDDVRKNYMVIEPDAETESFEESMLSAVRIKGLLDFELRYEGGRKKYYYDISELSPISESPNMEGLGCGEIESIILQFKNIFDELAAYMISETSLCIKKDCIYTDKDLGLKFCVVPGEGFDIRSCMADITGFIMIKAKEEPEAVMLARELFGISRKERFDIRELLSACESRRKSDLYNSKPEADGEESVREWSKREQKEPCGYEVKRLYESGDPEDIVPGPSEKVEELKKSKKINLLKREEQGKTTPGTVNDETEERIPEGADLIKRIAAAALIMVAAPLIIFILRGESALIRFIPVLAVVDIGILLYNLVGILERYNLMKKEREQEAIIKRAEL